MKSAIQWFVELGVPFDGDITIQDIIRIQEDSTATAKRILTVALPYLGTTATREEYVDSCRLLGVKPDEE